MADRINGEALFVFALAEVLRSQAQEHLVAALESSVDRHRERFPGAGYTTAQEMLRGLRYQMVQTGYSP